MQGIKLATLDRALTSLIAMLNWEVSHNFIKENPIAGIRKLKETDSDIKIRYLSDDKRARLLAIVEKRYDYMKLLIIVAMNTGIRRGSLFTLKWCDIDFYKRTTTLEAGDIKSEKQTILPINTTAYNELKLLEKKGRGYYVFPSPRTRGKLNNVQTSWENILKTAHISDFRFHDLRHAYVKHRQTIFMIISLFELHTAMLIFFLTSARAKLVPSYFMFWSMSFSCCNSAFCIMQA